MKISSARHLNRRDRLVELIAENGGPTAFAALVETPKTHISALTAGNRGVGDTLAAKIEKKCGKPPGWMDVVPTEGGMAFADLSAVEASMVTFLRLIGAHSPKRLVEIQRDLNHEAVKLGGVPHSAANPFPGAPAPTPTPPPPPAERKRGTFDLGAAEKRPPPAKKTGT